MLNLEIAKQLANEKVINTLSNLADGLQNSEVSARNYGISRYSCIME